MREFFKERRVSLRQDMIQVNDSSDQTVVIPAETWERRHACLSGLRERKAGRDACAPRSEIVFPSVPE